MKVAVAVGIDLLGIAFGYLVSHVTGDVFFGYLTVAFVVSTGTALNTKYFPKNA